MPRHRVCCAGLRQVLLNGLIGVFSNAFVTEPPADDSEGEGEAGQPPPLAPRIAAGRQRAARTRGPVEAARRRLRAALGRPAFWALRAVYTALALAEPLIVGCLPLLHRAEWAQLQLQLLAVSTALFAAQMAGTFFHIDRAECAPGPAGRLRLLLSDGSSLFESVCFALGWALIVERPGMSALRCFRVFRILWFFDLKAPGGGGSSRRRAGPRPVSLTRLCYLTVEVGRAPLSRFRGRAGRPMSELVT